MNAPAAISVFDRSALRLRRARASKTIAEFDFLLETASDQLIDRLSMIKRTFPLVVDLGGAHGVLARKLPLSSTIVSTDIAPDFFLRGDGLSIVTDEEFLPFAPQSLDAVFSCLNLQWVNDLPGTLAQIRHALKPDGLFLGAMMGGETLHELRVCLQEAELAVTGGVSPRVSPFVDHHTASTLVQRAGFALPVVDTEVLTVDYSSPLRLLQDLRGMGATNIISQRLKSFTRRQVVFEALRLYQEKFGATDGTIPATFQIIYMIGWAPHESQPKPLKPGSATVSLVDVLMQKQER